MAVMLDQPRAPSPFPWVASEESPYSNDSSTHLLLTSSLYPRFEHNLDGEPVPGSSVSRSYPTILRDDSPHEEYSKDPRTDGHHHSDSENNNWRNFTKIPPPSAVPGARTSSDAHVNSSLADRLRRAEEEEARARTRRLLGDSHAEPDYSAIQKDRARAFGAKSVDLPPEFLQRIPYNHGERNRMRADSGRSVKGAALMYFDGAGIVSADSTSAPSIISVPPDNSHDSTATTEHNPRNPRSEQAPWHNPLDTRRARQASSMARRLEAQPGAVSDFDNVLSKSSTRSTYNTAPDQLFSAPMGTTFSSATKRRPPTPPPKVKPEIDKASQKSNKTNNSFTGLYFRHRIASMFRRRQQRRLDRLEAKYADKNSKLARRMQDKHDALSLQEQRSQNKIDRQKAKDAERERQKRERMARTRRKMRRRRERAYSSAKGRNEAGPSEGVQTIDFAARGERGRSMAREGNIPRHE